MLDNWIGNIKLTGETEILDNDGTKIHDLIPCNQGAGVLVDVEVYPVLWDKLGGTEGDALWDSIKGLHQFNLFSRDITADRREWFTEGGPNLTAVYSSAGDLPKTYLNSPIHGEYIKVVGDATTDGFFQLNYYGSIFGSLTADFTFERMLRVNIGTGILNIFRLPNTNGQYAVALKLLANGTVQLLYDNTILGTSIESINYGATNHFCVQRVIANNSLEVYLNGVKVIEAAVTLYSATCVLDLNWGSYYGSTYIDVEFYGERFTSGLRYTENYSVADVPYATQAIIPEVPDMTAPAGSPHPYKIIADKT